MNKLLVALTVLASVAGTSTAYAVTTEIGPNDDINAAVNTLNAGDELVLGGGTYTLTARLGITVVGTEQQPVIIRAKDGELPVLVRNGTNYNIIDIEDSQHLILRGIEASGGSHGIRIHTSDFITIEDCHIHNTDNAALSANSGGEYEGLRILRNHIHDTDNTGEGMYLGCNDDTCRIRDSLIEGNYVHHTNGPNVSQGDGIEIKEGSFNNIVRDNVIHDAKYPCILTYSVVGNGGPNIIERNVMWNCADNGIQAAADAIIRNNIILSAGASAIANSAHQAGSPNNLEIVHNTIIQPQGMGIRSGDIVGTVLIANNAIYAQNDLAIRLAGSLSGVTTAGNVGVGGQQSVSGGWNNMGNIMSDFIAANYSGSTPNDVFPAMGGLPVGAGDPAYVTTDDFNGTARAGAADAGAYKYDANGNPGWTLGPDFKTPPPTGTGGAGGAGVGGGTSSGSGAGSGSGGGASSGSSGSGANGSAPGDLGEDSDCGCRVVGVPNSGSAGWLALLSLGALAVRRRR